MMPTPIIHEEKEPKRTVRRLPIVLMPRDGAILSELLDSRLLTLAQIADIHFQGKREAAKKRLQLLKRARLIQARQRISPTEPEPLRLTRAGYEWLLSSGALADRPKMTWTVLSRRLKVSPLTLRHELSVGDVKAAFHRQIRSTAFKLKQFVTWTRLLRFKVSYGKNLYQQIVSPDGFLQIESSSNDLVVTYDFYLELDRSTESIGRIVDRAAAYVAHYTTGGYARRRAGKDADTRSYPFRVLWVFPTQTRLKNFAKACREHNPPILKMMWLGVLNTVNENPLLPVWRRPVDIEESGLLHLIPPPSHFTNTPSPE